MGNNQTYKDRALDSLEGKWGKTAIAMLISFIISTGISYTMITPLGDNVTLSYSTQGLWKLLCLPLGWGVTVYFLNLIRNLDINFERLFDGYKDFIRIFLARFLVQLCIAVGFLLLIVPGIIVALMLSQTSFILKDNPDISAADAMKQSVSMMNGHKMELFWLCLSFIGWIILACMTLGLGFLLLGPYMYTTLAHYYEDLKTEQAL